MTVAFRDSESFKDSIARLFTVQDVIVGTGFLVGKKYVVTCAHVVNQALEGDDGSTEQPVDKKIYLDFPRSFPQKKYAAQVVCWHPPQPLDAMDVRSVCDIAILELDEIAPRDATETQFVSPARGEQAGHDFFTYGFPTGYDRGVSATGILRASELNDWLQLEAISNIGIPVQLGFSGAPVWDKSDNGVVGMIVEAAKKGIRVAFAIPTEKLIEAWPALDEYVNNNFALVAAELQRYLGHLSEHLALLPAYYPSGFSFDRIRQRIRMSQQYDPAYKGADVETMQAQRAAEEQEDSSAESVQAYKASTGGVQQPDVISSRELVDLGKKVQAAGGIGADGTVATEFIVIDWEILRAVAERVVILGDPGSGKSWLLKYEGRTVAREQLAKLEHGQLRPDEVLFPIFLRLGVLAEEITGDSGHALELIVQSLKRQYVPSASERFLNYIRHWLAGKQCLLLLDALDEVAEDRRKKIKKVLWQIGEESGCRILLTSRFVGYSSVPFVRKGGKWKQELEIVAFTQEQIEGFIHSWFVSRENDAQRLLTVLRKETFLRSLAGNPLLLSFLCLVTAESATIPTRRAALYERVLRLLLEASWRKDANDIPEELFDARLEAKLVLLQSLAWHFATLNGRWHDLMVTQELEEVVRKRSQDQDLVAMFPSYDTLIEELTEKDALLIKVGSSHRSRQKSKLPYLFLHRTIHEYLAARYLASLPIGECLKLVRSHFWFDSNWEVIILLLAGCLEDPNPLLDEFLHEPYDAFHTLLFLAGRCLVEAGPLLVKQDIRDKIINGLFDLLPSPSKYDQTTAIQVMGMIGEPVLAKAITLAQSKQGGVPLYPLSIRESAIRVLGQINHPRVLPELLTILTLQDGKAKQESDIELWTETAFALGRINDSQAIQALIDALNLEPIVSAVRSTIRQMDYSQAVYMLHKALKTEKNVINRNALIRALTNIGNAQAVTALLDVLRSNYRAYESLLSLRQFVARYLSILGNTEQKNSWLGTLKNAEPTMLTALSHRDDAAVKDLLDAIQGINAEEEDIGRKWDEAWNITQPDEEVLHVFISEKYQYGYQYGIWMLIELWVKVSQTRQDDRLARSLVLQLTAALKEIGDRRSVKALGHLLHFEYKQPWDNEFRRQLTRTVGAIGDPQIIADLLNTFRDCLRVLKNVQGDEEQVTDTELLLRDVIEALGRSGSPQVVRVFIASLKDNMISGFAYNYVIKSLVIDALGELGDNQAVDILLPMLYTEDWSVRQSVAQALGKLDSARAVDLLLSDLRTSCWHKILSYSIEFLRQEEATEKSPLFIGFLKYIAFRGMAESALASIGEAEKPQVVRALLKDSKTEKLHIRRIIKRSIGRSATSQDVALALGILLDKTEDLYTREKAAVLLARIGDERVVDSLLVCLQEAKFVSTIKTTLEQIAANCDKRVFCAKLLHADAKLALDLDVRVFIYDLLAQHRSQLREAVGKNWPNWRKKLFRLTAYIHSLAKLQYRIGQWSIRVLELAASWKTYKNQLYSAYQLYTKRISSAHSPTQPSPKYKTNIFAVIMALLGVRENTGEIIMTSLGIKENTAKWLSYSVGWLTGILFFLLWRRNSSVRLHALQSIIVFGSLNILDALCSSFPNLHIANYVLELTAFICWVVFMSLARQGKDFKLPIIGDWVRKLSTRK